MAGLGIRIYFDENIEVPLTDALKQLGYDVTHAYAEGNANLPDEQHLRFASTRLRTVVTHNFNDFVRLHADFLHRGEHHEGIILMPVRSLSEMLARLKKHLDSYPPAVQRDNLFWA